MKTDRIIITFLTLALLLAPGAIRAEDTNAPPSLDYNSFDIIATRNIFNPNRRNYIRRDTGPRTRIDSFTLVGTMTYEKGRFAFFEGTSSEFSKALKVTDVIAGYRVADIGQSSVTLLAAGNQKLKLSIGEQMKRTDNGPWSLLAHAEAVSSSKPGEPPGFSERSANLNGAQSDVLKRMMMRRLKEQQ